MSWQMVQAVLEHSQSKATARAVLLAIAYWSPASGSGAFRTNAQLQVDANCDERTVRRALRELKALGELRIVGQAKNGAHAFEIDLGTAQPTPGQIAPPAKLPPPEKSPGGRGQSARGPRANRPPLLNSTERYGTGTEDQGAPRARPARMAIGDIETHLQAAAWRALKAGAPYVWSTGDPNHTEILEALKDVATQCRAGWADTRHLRRLLDGVIAQWQRQGRRSA